MIVSRLEPGMDLKEGIMKAQNENNVESGIIICMVGSLKKAVLRMSDGKQREFTGPFEIVSAEGTISTNGVHVHLAVSDRDGKVFGGHLKPGCIVHTTAELCILESDEPLKRVFDPKTGYRELFVE